MVQKILRITGLKKRYNSKFCLTVDNIYTEKGKILTIIGPNGSGKSTLIRLINLLEKPDSGKIYFNNCEISGRGVKSTEVRKKMAVVFQEPLLFNTSVYNNIIMGLKIRKIKISEVKDRVDYFINKLKIVEEEADESIYFIELIEELDTSRKESLSPLKKEAHELLSIIVASINTARNKKLPNLKSKI